MNIRTCLLILSLLLGGRAIAQDAIYTRSGPTIKGTVTSVNGDTVTYLRQGTKSPELFIAKKDVIKILYKNGTADVFDKSAGPSKGGNSVKGHGSKAHGRQWNKEEATHFSKYGSNILSATGVFTTDMDADMHDLGTGICYERQLDRHGHFSVLMPVYVGYLIDDDFNPRFNGPTYVFKSAKGYKSFSFMPGVKYYPAAKGGVMRYSIGLSMYTLFGSQPNYLYDVDDTSLADRRYAVFGAMWSNSINVSISKHIEASLDMNFGAAFKDNRHSEAEFADYITNPFIQYMLKVGYRF